MSGLKKMAAFIAVVVVFIVGLLSIYVFNFDKRTIGIVAGVISFIAHPLYIWAIMRKNDRTIPHAFTWISSSILTGVSLLMYTEAGGLETVYLIWGDFLGLTAIAILSIMLYGKNGEYSTEDKICFIGALVSIAAYVAFHDALLALVLVLAAEVLGLIPTIRKTFKKSNQEDFVAWGFTFAGNVVNIFAIEKGIFAEEMYVGTIFVADGIIFALILVGWLKTLKR